MSHPAPLSAPDQGEARDHIAELPPGPSVATSYSDDAAIHNAHQSSDYAHLSPEVSHSSGPQHGSHSNVDLAMFDPSGVNQLGRRLSRISQESEDKKIPDLRSAQSELSNDTAVGEDSFNLEKTLKNLFQK